MNSKDRHAQRASRSALMRRVALTLHRVRRLDPTIRGLLWATLASILFVLFNTLSRHLAMQIHPLQSQFLRYLFGVLIMLPMVLRLGLNSFRPRNIGRQLLRGVVHTTALGLWFIALPRIPLADMTAIGFTAPIFVMIGAYLFFREPIHWERWLAALIGFGGVLIVVGPRLSGSGGYYNLIMLASCPAFAASLLIAKAATRYETTGVILAWQNLTVALLSLPLALLHWQAPTQAQWFGFLVCGALGSAAQYCITRAFRIADISAIQSVKFLELVWASFMGWLIFSESSTLSTLIGGLLISASTIWITRRESRRLGARGRPPP